MVVRFLTRTRKASECHLTCCKHGWSSSYCPTSSRPRGLTISRVPPLANEPTSLLGVVGTVPWRIATLAKPGSVIPFLRTWHSSSAMPDRELRDWQEASHPRVRLAGSNHAALRARRAPCKSESVLPSLPKGKAKTGKSHWRPRQPPPSWARPLCRERHSR